MITRNVALALPEDLLRRMKIIAAKRDTWISALLTATLPELADREEDYAEARLRGEFVDTNILL